MVIYKLTNIVTGEIYIGKTKNQLEKRWYQHKKDCQYGRNPNSRLYHAMRKYGADNFTKTVMAECTSLEELNAAEIQLIKEHSPQYNIAKGGNGGWINDQTGKRWKVKDTSRMGVHLIGKAKSAGMKQKISGANNYQSSEIVITPWGEFFTYAAAIDKAKLLRSKGHLDVVTDRPTLRRYCEADITLNDQGRRTFKEWRGRNTKEIGFDKRQRF